MTAQASSLAGAKTKYTAAFRLNQHSPRQLSKSKLPNQDSLGNLHQGSNTQSGLFGQTAPSTNQQSDSNLPVHSGTQSSPFLDVFEADRRQTGRAAMNLVEANANSTRDLKAKALEANQSKVEQLHAKQMAKLDVSKSGLLHQMEKMLPQKYKKIFLEH